MQHNELNLYRDTFSSNMCDIFVNFLVTEIFKKVLHLFKTFKIIIICIIIVVIIISELPI